MDLISSEPCEGNRVGQNLKMVLWSREITVTAHFHEESMFEGLSALLPKKGGRERWFCCLPKDCWSVPCLILPTDWRDELLRVGDP